MNILNKTGMGVGSFDKTHLFSLVDRAKILLKKEDCERGKPRSYTRTKPGYRSAAGGTPPFLGKKQVGRVCAPPFCAFKLCNTGN